MGGKGRMGRPKHCSEKEEWVSPLPFLTTVLWPSHPPLSLKNLEPSCHKPNFFEPLLRHGALRYFEAILESQKERTDFQKEVSRFANKKFRFCYDLFLQPSHVQPKCKGPMNFSKDFVFGVSLMAGDEWIPLQKR